MGVPAPLEETVRKDQPQTADQPRRIGFFRAMAFTIWGPADLGPDHPLAGTKYDPAVKRARELQRRQARGGHAHL